MKLTIYPSKETVSGIIKDRIAEQQKLIDEDNTRLTALTDGTILVKRNGEESMLKASIKARTEYLDDANRQLKLLESDTATHVAVEVPL